MIIVHLITLWGTDEIKCEDLKTLRLNGLGVSMESLDRKCNQFQWVFVSDFRTKHFLIITVLA